LIEKDESTNDRTGYRNIREVVEYTFTEGIFVSVKLPRIYVVKVYTIH